ncbi:MAG: tRNA (adenosine(37)-N6)-threonylcarbamoyltransferase complex dimerization subunit type 1 TsaB [Candidatus Margulisiibacteriota bacterium]|jgi:tRNA threonylcarbamoyladenosine biosynthesis protein TsaB
MFLGINLAIDRYSIGIVNEGKLIAEINLESERDFSENLILEIDLLLKRKGLNVSHLKSIGIAHGPGSYTGLRLATIVAKTIAMMQQIPVYGFSTLDAIVQGFAAFDGIYFTILKAMGDEVNAAVFAVNNREIKKITPDFVVKIEVILKKIEQINELVYVIDFSKKEDLLNALAAKNPKIRIVNDFYLKGSTIALMAEANYKEKLPGNYRDLIPHYSYAPCEK